MDRLQRFLDLRYRELTADPIGTVRRVYDFFAIPLSADAEARMRRYMSQNLQAKHGVHSYSLAQFGIDRDTENERGTRPEVSEARLREQCSGLPAWRRGHSRAHYAARRRRRNTDSDTARITIPWATTMPSGSMSDDTAVAE